MNIFGVAGLLMPEIFLCAITFGVLITDIFFMRQASVEERQEVLGRFVLMGLACTGLLYLIQLKLPGAIVLGNGAFVANQLNTVFKILVVSLGFITVLIGLNTPYSSHVGEYYSLLLFSILGMLFLISSEELLMIFVALELVSLTLYVLTAFQKGARRSVEGGLKYFIFGGLSAAFLLFGLSYIYGATGQTSLRDIAAALTPDHIEKVPIHMLNIGILFTLVGLGFKIAAVPFHLWAPDAYEGAPTPVAALIATGSKVASFVVLTKLLLVGLVGVAGNTLSWMPTHWHSGWTGTVTILAFLSMTLGNFAAISQRNVKRLLAYSSIAHAGYIMVAMVAIDASGAVASNSIPSIYFYVLIYALTNIGAFGVINVIASKVGGDDFSHFTGMARRAPFLSLLMLIFLLSLAGIPPLAGFFGKFYLFASAVQADPKNLGLLWLVIWAIAMSAVSLYYYLKLAKQMYVIPATDPTPLKTCPTSGFVLGFVCLLVVLLGVFPSTMVQILENLQKKAAAIPGMVARPAPQADATKHLPLPRS